MAFQQTTPKPQSIETKLDEVESILGRLSFGIGKDAILVLAALDQAKLRIDGLVDQGITPKAELAQFESISSNLRRDGQEFLKQIGGTETLKQKRVEVMPPRENWWWYIDEELASDQRLRLWQSLRTAAITLAIFLVVVVVYRMFFTPDPSVIAEVTAQQNADMLLIDGNLEEALTEIDLGLVKVPDSAELLIYKATILEAMGKTEDAAPIFQRAEDLIGNPEIYGLTRAQILNMMNRPKEAESLLLDLLKEFPTSGRAYLLLGQSYETMGNQKDALDAYEKASVAGEQSNDPTTSAQARIKMGMLMQVYGVPQFGVTPTVTTNP